MTSVKPLIPHCQKHYNQLHQSHMNHSLFGDYILCYQSGSLTRNQHYKWLLTSSVQSINGIKEYLHLYYLEENVLNYFESLE